MRRFLVPLFAVAICASAFPTLATAQDAPWANKLFTNALEHDFGAVKHDAQLKHEFKITNIYKVPLDITDITVSCGCVKVEPSTKSLKPSESATITVNMDPAKANGPTIVKIKVTVGPKFVSTATLTVTANVQNDVGLSVKEIDFGEVARGQTPTKQIDIEYLGKSKDWKVEQINHHPDAPFTLKVDHLPAKTDGPARKGFRLLATLKADAAPGAFKQPVTLKTNDPARPTISFDVIGAVQGALSLSTDIINFGSVKVGAPQTKKVVVKGPNAFRVAKVDGQADGITVDFPPEKNTALILTVNFTPTKAGDFRRQLTIRTDDASVQLTVEAKVEP